jgi:hypothetical protein
VWSGKLHRRQGTFNDFLNSSGIIFDPPTMKWPDLRYVFGIKEDCNGKEALKARIDRREAATGQCLVSQAGACRVRFARLA